MIKIVILASIILTAGLFPAYGANVAVFAEGIFADYTDPDGLLPFSQPAPGTIFRLEFTYDDDLPDDVPIPEVGFYSDALLAATLKIGGNSFEMGENGNDITILNDIEYRDSNDTLTGYSDGWITSTHSETSDADPSYVVREGFNLVLISQLQNAPVPPLLSDTLIQPSWPSDWDSGSISYSIHRQLADGSEASESLASAWASITSITVVPVPSALWLFGSALGLLGWARCNPV